jgi:EAL domain-containing protein (putative c-di-GMP-specific phosphodiesterase class I)
MGVSGPADRAERIMSALRQPLTANGEDHLVTASVGVSFGDGRTDQVSLIADADIAMRRAKALGRNRCLAFQEEWRDSLLSRIQLERELHRAVALEQIVPYYQPVHDTITGALVGFEALARWEHPLRGTLPPADFIEHAESTGLIVAIGESILTQATVAIAEWRAESGLPLTMSVNVSPRELSDAGLGPRIKRSIRAAGLQQGALRIEITESALIDIAVDPAPLLAELRAHGAAIILDDFGTGFSSLSSLCRFPLDGLKIDRSFVARLPDDIVSTAVVKAVIDLAASRDLTVVAEGVERTEQLAAVKSHGCGFVQGYLYEAPLPRTAANQYVVSHASCREHA